MWLRPKAFAERYKVTHRTVWRWIQKGTVKTKRVGETTFILDDDSDPTQLDAMHKKIDEILHHVRKSNHGA